MCCFGIPTYQSSKGRFANDHANVQQNWKLILFLNYYVQQLIESQNIPIEMWNIIKHQHWTNNAVEGWNSKLNSFIGKQQPNVFLQVQKLKEKYELVTWQLKSTESGEPGQKRRKINIKQEERIKNIMEVYGTSDDLYKCLKALNSMDKRE